MMTKQKPLVFSFLKTNGFFMFIKLLRERRASWLLC